MSSEVGPSHALLGPFTLREVVFGVGVLVMFIGTLLPFVDGRVLYTTFWGTTSLFFTGIGILLPVVALALLAGRRLGSSGLRVGSLSVDQFASVTAVLAATFFFLQTVTAFSLGAFLALIGSLVLLAATVLGALLPRIKDDFTDRPEAAAHPLARPITTAVPRPPKAAKPAASDSDPAVGPDSGSEHASVSGGTTVDAGTRPADAGVPGVAQAAGGAGAVAAPRDPMTASGSGNLPASSKKVTSSTGTTSSARVKSSAGASAAVTAPSAGTTGQEESAQARPLTQSPTTSDGGSTGARSVGTVGTPSDERVAEQAVASSSGSSNTPAVDDVADAKATNDESVVGESTVDTSVVDNSTVDETRVHEAVRDEPGATRTTVTTASNAARSGAERSRQEPISATRSVDEERVVEAFWFAVGSPRPVFDEQTGREIFVLQPGDWEVGIEDRGHDFLVQDKRSGAVGILRDLRNIERAPRD